MDQEHLKSRQHLSRIDSEEAYENCLAEVPGEDPGDRLALAKRWRRGNGAGPYRLDWNLEPGARMVTMGWSRITKPMVQVIILGAHGASGTPWGRLLPAVVVANSVNVVMDNAKTLVAVVVVGTVGRQATNTAAETIVFMASRSSTNG